MKHIDMNKQCGLLEIIANKHMAMKLSTCKIRQNSCKTLFCTSSARERGGEEGRGTGEEEKGNRRREDEEHEDRDEENERGREKRKWAECEVRLGRLLSHNQMFTLKRLWLLKTRTYISAASYCWLSWTDTSAIEVKKYTNKLPSSDCFDPFDPSVISSQLKLCPATPCPIHLHTSQWFPMPTFWTKGVQRSR